MELLLVAISTAVAVEIFLRTPFDALLHNLADTTKRAGKTLSSQFISDHWKEVVLPRYAFMIFKNSALLLGCLLITALPVIVIDRIGAQFGFQTLATMATGLGFFFSLLIATLYVFIRAQILSDADYTPLQKLLHFLALSNSSIGEATFDAEIRGIRNKSHAVEKEQHVFISGFARAGTTILMRSLYGTNQFASLTYADMPFVLAPNLWCKIAGKGEQRATSKERAHGDGILVNYDSPEALEEVFWKVFAKDDYVARDSLRPHKATPDLVERYRQYVSAIVTKYDKTRYISKNNNNILRLDSIHSAFPNSAILVPFRDPVQHAFSLLKQHRIFSGKQREDAFVRHYMSWLGHYEFGLTHKRFEPDEASFKHNDTEFIDYWLEQWNTVYRFLLEQPIASSDNVVFISYELLCAESDHVWKQLSARLNLMSSETPTLTNRIAQAPQPRDASLLKSASEIYELLDQRCRSTLRL